MSILGICRFYRHWQTSSTLLPSSAVKLSTWQMPSWKCWSMTSKTCRQLRWVSLCMGFTSSTTGISVIFIVYHLQVRDVEYQYPHRVFYRPPCFLLEMGWDFIVEDNIFWHLNRKSDAEMPWQTCSWMLWQKQLSCNCIISLPGS